MKQLSGVFGARLQYDQKKVFLSDYRCHHFRSTCYWVFLFEEPSASDISFKHSVVYKVIVSEKELPEDFWNLLAEQKHDALQKLLYRFPIDKQERKME